MERFFKVDPEDEPLVSAFRWKKHKGRYTFYVSALVWKGGKPRRIYLHREIMKATKGVKVDHRDGNGLDNRRLNLRSATHAQNLAGKRHRGTGFKSRFRGVYLHKQNQNWCATIKVNYKKTHLGSFSVEEDAARAYDVAAKAKFGEFAQLNFPLDALK